MIYFIFVLLSTNCHGAIAQSMEILIRDINQCVPEIIIQRSQCFRESPLCVYGNKSSWFFGRAKGDIYQEGAILLHGKIIKNPHVFTKRNGTQKLSGFRIDHNSPSIYIIYVYLPIRWIDVKALHGEILIIRTAFFE